MRSSRLVRMVGVGVLTGAAATLGFSATASAEPADDVPIIIENLPAAAEALAASLQEAATDAAEHQSAVQTSADVGDAVVEAGTILTTDTEQFGALGLGLMLMNGVTQQGLAPYLGAVDDPSTAGDLITPDDVTAIAEGVAPFVEAAQEPLKDGAVHLLEGNVIEPPLGGGPAFYSAAVVGTLEAGYWEFAETPIAPAFQIAGISSIVVGAATEGQISEAEASLAPVFDGAAPVTEQLIAVIEGL